MLNYYQHIIDLVDEGLIAIDRQGKIKIYNEEAANIFGIDPRLGPGHDSGRLTKGDIVIIADNHLGRDDGGLTPGDLEKIGVGKEQVKKGQALVVIGKKGAEPGTAVISTANSRDKPLLIKEKLNNLNIEARISFGDKLLNIKINEDNYPFYYSFAAGHMVILDGEHHNLKFYQARGYTARKEGIKELLQGREFISKGPRGEKPEIYDKHISIFHPDSRIIKRLLDIANKQAESIKNEESIINGVPTRCAIVPIKEDREVQGALLKVEDIRELKTVIKERDKALSSIQYLENQLQARERKDKAFSGVLGVSKKFEDALQMAYKASETISNVLLLGESGTGKNLLARAIHQASKRREGPLIYINCASIPENLFESELFGYEKGSFTGALASGKKGKLAEADGGTLFLDEIAELPLSLQAKFLHFLQDRTYTRVGGIEEQKVDVRFIFATNRDLVKLVEEGKFREDLFFRINVMPIELPPLRERREDIPLLAQNLITKICNKIAKRPKKIGAQAMEYLIAHTWKGNIRELENVLERAVNICEEDIIKPEHLPAQIINSKIRGELVRVRGVGPLKKAVQQTEKQLIQKALEKTGGSRKKAIKKLDIGKTTFYSKLKKYNI